MKLAFYKDINSFDKIRIFINKDDGELLENKKYKNVYSSIKSYPYTIFYFEECLANNYNIGVNKSGYYYNYLNYKATLVPITREEIIDLQILLSHKYTTNTYIPNLIINLLNINMYYFI